MNRVSFVFFIFIAVLFVIVYRLFHIQILGSSGAINASRFMQIDKQISLRGHIFDTKGTPLAINKTVYEVYGNIDAIKKDRRLEDLLQKQLKIKDSTMSALMRLDNWRRMKRGVDDDTKKRLEKYYPTYLNFEQEWTRYYPEGSSSAYLLGFVGRDEAGAAKGYLGLEGYFNRELTGLPSVRERESDFLGVPFIGGIYREKDSTSGFDLYSSIDINVQKMVEQQLLRGLELYEAHKACAIVIEPESGKIRGFSCLPGYDQRSYYDYKETDFANPLISSVYEPGSTFKPLIVAMAVNEGKVKANTIVDESEPLRIGEYTIHTWNDSYRGKVTVQQTLEKSSNVGMVHIIRKLSKRTVDNYFERLGLYEATGIELEGEGGSLIKDVSSSYEIDFATLSFGQGMAITPLQLVQAFSTLANGGYMVRPTLVEKIVDSRTGVEVPVGLRKGEKVFSSKTIATMKKMLYSTVENSEAFWPTKQPGYRYCGKTGTAQIAVKGTYDATKTIASFIGFLPCDNPKFLTLVLYYQPQSSQWGSETAAPTFFDIASDLTRYYNIAPQE